MYPANKEKLAAQSGTGIYYQAIPAVAADGRNIMKLIPVQMVNSQFFQTDVRSPGRDSAHQKGAARNVAFAPVQVFRRATLDPSAPLQSGRTQVTSANALSTPVELDHGYSLSKLSLQQRPVHSAAKVPTTAASATHCNELVRRPRRLPVTVKSPALPKGHHIVIPPNAQVQTVPASELPPGIKKQICVSSDSSSAASGLQSVVLVSPVTAVIQGAARPDDSTAESFKLRPNTSNQASCAPQLTGAKPHLKLIPKVSLRPNSPIKWVIEEENGSTGPDKNPLCSSSVTTRDQHWDFIRKTPSVSSETLPVLAEREPSKHCNAEKPMSQLTQSKRGQGQDNALVMCNGKVFFLAKKCSLPFKLGQNDPTSQQPVEPHPELRIVIPDESDDVIDLCDDEDSTQQEASVDEDNVIFVSYIPPKAESASQTPSVSKLPEVETSSSSRLTVEGTSEDEKDDSPALSVSRPGQSAVVSNEKNAASVCGSAAMNSHARSPRRSCSQQEGSGTADVGTESPAGPDMSESCSHRFESSPSPTSSLAPQLCQKADQQLRREFGITAYLNVCLQRIDENCSGLVSVSHTNSLQHLDVSCKKRERDYDGFISVKKVKLQSESSPDTKGQCHSGHSSLCGSSCDCRGSPAFGYGEPIDEDFPSRPDDNISKSQSCKELNTNTRRIGRMRKRTMCPCCTAGSRLDHADRLAWLPEQMRKKEGRTHAPGKD